MRLNFNSAGMLKFTIESETGEIVFFSKGGRFDVRFYLKGRVITDAPASDRRIAGCIYGEWTISSLEEARELYLCITHIVQFSHQARRVGAAALSHLMPRLAMTGPEELDCAAGDLGHVLQWWEAMGI
jgi:hypothetical protein